MPKISVDLFFPFITTCKESLNSVDSLGNVFLNIFISPMSIEIVLSFYDKVVFWGHDFHTYCFTVHVPHSHQTYIWSQSDANPLFSPISRHFVFNSSRAKAPHYPLNVLCASCSGTLLFPLSSLSFPSVSNQIATHLLVPR